MSSKLVIHVGAHGESARHEVPIGTGARGGREALAVAHPLLDTHRTRLSYVSIMTDLTLDILAQPDDSTCGPTCLHAVYGFHGVAMDLDQVVAEVTSLATGGTLSAFLGIHGLRQGFDATIYTYNLEVFDPTWFEGGADELVGLLREQSEVKGSGRLRLATSAYIEFLERGGRIRHVELRPDLIRHHLVEGHPILTGLSATYLYACAREVDQGGRLRYDSVRGEPTGHFVVLHGYDADTDSVLVADPLRENAFGSHNYRVGMLRLLGAILLGVLTYDGNLLVLTPRRQTDA